MLHFHYFVIGFGCRLVLRATMYHPSSVNTSTCLLQASIVECAQCTHTSVVRFFLYLYSLLRFCRQSYSTSLNFQIGIVNVGYKIYADNFFRKQQFDLLSIINPSIHYRISGFRTQEMSDKLIMLLSFLRYLLHSRA